MSRRTDHSLRADEILSDGEWHDGLEFVREVEKVIAPGPAHRFNEDYRNRASARRHGETKERVRELDMAKSVSSGKRGMVRKTIFDMLRSGTWEIDPNPLPQGAWRTGGWKIRDTRAMSVAISSLLGKPGFEVGLPTLRQLIEDEPLIPVIKAGRVIRIGVTELPELQDRVKRFRAKGRRPPKNPQVRICPHCGKPAGDYALLRRHAYCHPQSGLDCYILVRDHNHSTPCEQCR